MGFKILQTGGLESPLAVRTLAGAAGAAAFEGPFADDAAFALGAPFADAAFDFPFCVDPTFGFGEPFLALFFPFVEPDAFLEATLFLVLVGPTILFCAANRIFAIFSTILALLSNLPRKIA